MIESSAWTETQSRAALQHRNKQCQVLDGHMNVAARIDSRMS
jgi:hypothetical protein